jgi:flagellar basal body-associated protein FliL
MRGMTEAAAEKTEKAPAAPGGGNKKLLFIVLGVNVLLIGGLAYVLVSARNQPAAPAAKAHASKEGEAEAEGEGHEDKAKEGEAEEEPEAEGDKKAKPAGKFGPLLDVGTFVANLSVPPEQTARYAKVGLSVEAFNEEAKVRVEAAIVPIRAEALMMFSNAKPDDVVGQEKILALGEELTKRANKLVGKKSVRKVYFSELVVQ